MDNKLLWNVLKKHFGHHVTIAVYGDLNKPTDVCLECEDCGEIIVDAGLYTLCANEERM